MKSCYLIPLCFIAATLGLTGCASKPSASAAADPGKERKGHWEIRDPETGSHIARRVWVDEKGYTTNTASMGNVQTGSAAALQRSQNSHSGRPIGQ